MEIHEVLSSNSAVLIESEIERLEAVMSLPDMPNTGGYLERDALSWKRRMYGNMLNRLYSALASATEKNHG